MAKEGFLHKIDDLGRVLLPKELRKELCWDIGDTLSLCRVSGVMVVSLGKKKHPEPVTTDEGPPLYSDPS